MRIITAVLTLAVLSASTFSVPTFADAPAPQASKKPFLPNKVDLPQKSVALLANRPSAFTFTFTLPANHHLNTQAPSRMVITEPDTDLAVTTPIQALNHSVTIPARTAKSGTLEFSTVLYYCEDGNTSLCLIRGLAITQPYDVSDIGSAAHSLAITVPE